MAYLNVEKPRFLFLEGSAGAKATVVAATVVPPDASAAHATSSVDRPAAGAPVPAQVLVPSPPPRLSVRGRRLPPLRGPAPRHFPFPLLSPTTSTPTSPGERVPAARAAGTLHLSAPGTGSPAPSSAPPAPVPPAAPRTRLGSGCGRVGLRSVHGHPMLGRTRRQIRGGTWQKDKGKGEPPLHEGDDPPVVKVRENRRHA
jgi:hypothetical protein